MIGEGSLAQNRGPWCRIYSGKLYYPFQPQVEDIELLDIAHSLSMICRYNGQCARFYSVAEHSVLVSKMVPAEFALEGLLHDAAEAYCHDIMTPIKDGLLDYLKMLWKNEKVVRERFRLPNVESICVKRADEEIYAIEIDQLFPYHEDCRAPKGTRYMPIRALTPFDAKIEFLARYAEVRGDVRV